MKKFNEYNESVRDMMKPKSDEDIKQSIKGLLPNLELQKGAEFGFLWAVEDAIERGADVTSDHHHALACGIQGGHLDIIKVLVINDDLNQELLDWALVNACKFGQIDVVKFFLQQGANPNAWKKHYFTDIPKDKKVEIMSLLKRYGRGYGFNRNRLKINESVRDQMTPKSEEGIIKKLSDLNGYKLSNYLMRAIMVEDVKLIELIIQHGNMGLLDTPYRNEVMKVAIDNNNLTVLKYFLEKDLPNSIMMSLRDYAERNWKLGIVGLIDKYINTSIDRYNPTNEGVRDQMTPKSKIEINSAIQKYLKKIDNPLSEYVGKKRSIYNDIIETLGESKEDLDMIDRYVLRSDDFYTLHKFFLTLTQGSTPKVFTEKTYQSYIIVVECFTEYKLASLTTYGKTGSVSQWVIAKKYFENRVNEGIRDHMTPKPEADIRKAVGRKHGLELFFKACQFGYLDIVQKTFDKVKKMDFYKAYLQVGIKNAVANNELEVLKYLIANCDMNYDSIIEDNFQELLRTAVQMNYVEMVKYLISIGSDMYVNNDEPLRLAVLGNRLELVEYFLTHGCSVHTQDDYCFRWANTPEMRALLNKYANMNESLRSKMTPKSKEEINRSLENLPIKDKIKVIVNSNMIDEFGREEFKKLLLYYPTEMRIGTIVNNPRVRDIYTEFEIKNMFKELPIANKLQFLRTRSELKDLFDDGQIVAMLLDYMRKTWFPSYGEKLKEDEQLGNKASQAIDRACSERPIATLGIPFDEILYTGEGIPYNSITSAILKGVIFLEKVEQRFDTIRNNDKNTYNIYHRRGIVVFIHNNDEMIWYFNKEMVIDAIMNIGSPKMIF